ncbi:MAG: EAL domain-containing protein [Gammaproteobacteria bacterium]|nr:EAL domain-containing protein [Gammaproteobacteria bacterium]
MSNASQKPTLLVADDEEEIGEIFRALAEDLGFDVTCVNEGSEVVELVDRMQPTVIALDLRMPGTDGVEVIRELARRSCKAAIVLMSGMDQRTLSSVQALGKELNLDIGGTLTKPASIDAIESALKPYLNVKKESRPDISRKPPSRKLDYGFEVLYQPELVINQAVNSAGEKLLVRMQWRMDDGMIITGLRLDNWIKENSVGKGISRMALDHALENIRTWSGQGFSPEVCVSLEESLLLDLDLPDMLGEMVDRSNVAREFVGIEIEEDSFMRNRTSIADVLSRLRIKGFRIVLNVLGEGENVLPYLDKLPIDKININMSSLSNKPNFLNNMETEFLYSSLASLCKQNGLLVCGDNINTEDQMKFARKCNFNSIRGRQISAPLHAEEILPLYTDGELKNPREVMV